jgi:hypothetical protein
VLESIKLARKQVDSPVPKVVDSKIEKLIKPDKVVNE